MNVFAFLTVLVQTAFCDYDNRVITTLKYSKHVVKPTIVNGEPAKSGEVPYLVSLKEPTIKIDDERTVWENLCGGSIISEERVLTAAHCFEGMDFFYAKNPNHLRVVAGDIHNDITNSGVTETTEAVQWRQLKKITLHKDFNFPSNDIALVFVDEPWIFTDRVDLIGLASKTSDYPKSCVSAGYGRTGYGTHDAASPVLLLAPIRIITRWHCSVIWDMNMNDFICTDSAFTDVANGDSGGPLACHGTADPEEMPGRDLLVGVVSGKNFDRTTLYTRVSAYRGWIDRNVANKLYFNFLLITLLIVIYILFY